jgi:ribosomal protein L11 methyltransferase
VLALAAAKLGATSAAGVDIDPDALANATENLELNDLADLVRFEQGDFRNLGAPADVVLANLTGALLERASGRLSELVNAGGHLIISGFMVTERAAVVAALERYLALQTIEQEDEWMCAVYKSRQM